MCSQSHCGIHMAKSLLFFFNDTATTEIYTLSLHDALPIFTAWSAAGTRRTRSWSWTIRCGEDRKSTRLNSSHLVISYAVFCLKKKHNADRAVGRLQKTHQAKTRARERPQR